MLLSTKPPRAIPAHAGDISKLNLADLAKMERLKREGLAQVSIDKFTNGVINISIDAGLKAIG